MLSNDNVRKLNAKSVLQRYKRGEDFLCPFCRVQLEPLVPLEHDSLANRQKVMGLHCPNNSNHFSVYSEGDRQSKMHK